MQLYIYLGMRRFCRQNYWHNKIINAPINIMPHPGYIGEKVGHLTCFDTKTCPMCGEFDRLPYACATINYIKAPTIKFPIFSSIFEWGESWDLTDWHAQ